ncbi:MAG: hypothetical protein AB8F94_24090 [Saprospiraceae bacterium]
MFKNLSNIIWLFLGLGIYMLMSDSLRANIVFADYYITSLKVYLFAIGAYLVLKRVLFYRLRGNINIVSLGKKSEYQNNLLIQGIVLALLGLGFVQAYGSLRSIDTLVIALLGLYYWAQIVLNSNPTIYLDDNSFSYDDYFIDKWNWADLSQIDMKNEKLKLIGSEKDFELDFDLVDEVDYRKLTQEMERDVLDGEFGKDKSSKSLVEIIESYAKNFNVPVA